MSTPALSSCARLVQAGDPDRFLAAMTAPSRKRERLMALYAFNLELARVPAAVSEPRLGEIRLQWWADAVAEIAAGAPVRGHEVVDPLAEAVRAASLPRALLDGMIAARQFDLGAAPHVDMETCSAYLAATAGALMLLSAQALAGPLNAAARAALADLGLAHGAANLLAATPAQIARGRPVVPFDAGPGDRNALAEGRCPPAFAGAVAALAKAGLDAHTRARSARRAIPAAASPAARAAWRARPLLRVLTRDPGQVMATPRESEFQRRFSLLARAVAGRW